MDEEAGFGVGTRGWQSVHENHFLLLTLTRASAVPGMEGAGQGTGRAAAQDNAELSPPPDRC